MNKMLLGICTVAIGYMTGNAQTLVTDKEKTQIDSLPLYELDGVVVSDSRFPLKRENSGKTVIKISATEMLQNQGRTVAEIINTKSGIEINGTRSFSGQNLSIFARGGNNRQVLVLIDGIQVNDPSSPNAEYDLRMLATEQIESIEIVKGASSTLYGNAAATAVINITTKRPANGKVRLDVSSSLGTNRSQKANNYALSNFKNNVALSGKRDRFSYMLGGGNHFTNGMSAALGTEKDAVSQLDGFLKLGYSIANNLQIMGTAFYTKLDSDYDNGYPVEDADFHFTSEQSRFTLNTTYSYDQGNLQVNGGFNQIIREFSSNFPTFYDSESFVMDVFNRYTFRERLHTIVGLNGIWSTTKFQEAEQMNTLDPYANVVYISDFGMNLNTGIRLNTHSAYGNHLIYNINPSYSIGYKEGYLKFLGSYATSFIAPNLSQLYGPFGPNPILKPEEDATLEGGLEFKPNANLTASILYYKRKEVNRIQYVTINPETFESQYINITNPVYFSGYEAELTVKPNEKLSLTTNYTLTKTSEVLGLRVPKNKLNANLGYTFGHNAYASLNYQWISTRNDTNFVTNETITLDDFGLMDFYASYTLTSRCSVNFSLSNIFNTDYIEIIDYTTKGRNMRVGLQLSL